MRASPYRHLPEVGSTALWRPVRGDNRLLFKGRVTKITPRYLFVLGPKCRIFTILAGSPVAILPGERR